MRRLFSYALLLAFAACTPVQVGAPARPRVDATDTTGLSPAEVKKLVQPAAEPMHRCAGSSAGKITVRVSRRDGVIDVEPEPGTSLDPTVRKCVLDALSSIALEETGSNAGGPAVPPPGFVSLVTVTW